jgi:hypothetical protein
MERTILTGAMLLDGTGTAPVAGRAVVVEDGRISAVVAAPDAPPGTTLHLADLLAVAGNPLERIEALDEVRLVMARGRVAVNRLT